MDDDDVFEVMKYIDERFSEGAFQEVDMFIRDLDVFHISNPAYLLSIYTYVYLAEERGNTLPSGAQFKKLARSQLETLVGEERTAKLLKFRGG